MASAANHPGAPNLIQAAADHTDAYRPARLSAPTPDRTHPDRHGVGLMVHP